jgi:hypothetical protein
MRVGIPFLMPNVAHFNGTVSGDTMRGTYVQGGAAAPCKWFARAPEKGKGSEKEKAQLCRDMQDKVDRACDPGLEISRKCVGPPKKLEGEELAEYCERLKLNRAQNEACRKARVEINRVCYGGGDKGHKKGADQAREARDKCDKLLAEHCKGL